MLNLFQHLTSLEDLFAINKILNSLKITDKSPYFLRFQNDTKIIFDFNSSPSGERISGRTTQLVANSDIPPQRGSGFADGRCNLLQVRIARKLSKLEPQVQLRNFTSVEQIQDRLGGVQPVGKTLILVQQIAPCNQFLPKGEADWRTDDATYCKFGYSSPKGEVRRGAIQNRSPSNSPHWALVSNKNFTQEQEL